MGQYIRTDL